MGAEGQRDRSCECSRPSESGNGLLQRAWDLCGMGIGVGWVQICPDTDRSNETGTCPFMPTRISFSASSLSSSLVSSVCSYSCPRGPPSVTPCATPGVISASEGNRTHTEIALLSGRVYAVLPVAELDNHAPRVARQGVQTQRGPGRSEGACPENGTKCFRVQTPSRPCELCHHAEGCGSSARSGNRSRTSNTTLWPPLIGM